MLRCVPEVPLGISTVLTRTRERSSSRLLPLLLLFGSSTGSGVPLSGQIFLTNQTVPLDISARVTLGGRDGYEQLGNIYGPEEPVAEYHFSFPSPVPTPGDYVLRIESRKYEFQNYFVKVGHRDEDPVQVALFDDKSLKMLPGTWLPHPLAIHPLRLFPLVEAPAPSMSLVQILKGNPLIWLMGLGLILMLAIPKLMENLDEETLKEVRESQKEMHQNMASLQNFDSSKFAKYLAGGGTALGPTEAIPDLTTVRPKSASGPDVSASNATGATRNGGSGGKSKKRRVTSASARARETADQHLYGIARVAPSFKDALGKVRSENRVTSKLRNGHEDTGVGALQ